MTGLTRRRLLGGAAAAAGGAGLGLFPPALQQALAATPAQDGSLDDIEHVVFVPMENRSFDHYFGTLPGVRGFDDPTALTLPNGRSVFYQPSQHPDGYQLPFHLDTTTTSAAALNFDPVGLWPSSRTVWNHGKMDQFVSFPEAAGVKGTLTMGYYKRQDIPFHFALADEFTVCDNYFTAVLGESVPNYLMWMCGTIDPAGEHGGPILEDDFPNGPLTLTTQFEQLQAAGVSWRYYHATNNGANFRLESAFAQYAAAAPGSPLYENGVREHPLSDFRDDVLNGRLPQYSEVWPSSVGAPDASEHMPGLPALGASFLYNLLDALASNPEVWAKTVVFITYDDFGGFFDHVAPPTAPEGTEGEWLTVDPLPTEARGIAGPIGLGLRVPMLVVSPFSRGGWVANETFDHTSILRFCEQKFGVPSPQISAWRRETVGDLTSTLRFKNPDHKPLAKILATFPDTAHQLALEQQEVATLPPPQVPTVQTVPHQEPGNRPRTL